MPPMSSRAPQTFDIDKIISRFAYRGTVASTLKEDLLPFWETPQALGEPLGNFPTYRTMMERLSIPKIPDLIFRMLYRHCVVGSRLRSLQIAPVLRITVLLST